MYYYFLTMDKCIYQGGLPLKSDYRNYMEEIFHMTLAEPTGIECYEYKSKLKKYPKWLHYHCILKSKVWIKFRDFPRREGYSVDIQSLKSIPSILHVVNYINKDKFDKVELTYNDYMNSKEEVLTQNILDELDQL